MSLPSFPMCWVFLRAGVQLLRGWLPFLCLLLPLALHPLATNFWGFLRLHSTPLVFLGELLHAQDSSYCVYSDESQMAVSTPEPCVHIPTPPLLGGWHFKSNTSSVPTTHLIVPECPHCLLLSLFPLYFAQAVPTLRLNLSSLSTFSGRPWPL